MIQVERLLVEIARWGESRADIVAVALVGSWARETAAPDSDIDLVIIAADPSVYERDDAWLGQFGMPRRVDREDWGLVQSRRVFYEHGPGVEFGLTSPVWIGLDPIDEGTARVIAGGARVVFDRTGRLAFLIEHVRSRPNP